MGYVPRMKPRRTPPESCSADNVSPVSLWVCQVSHFSLPVLCFHCCRVRATFWSAVPCSSVSSTLWKLLHFHDNHCKSIPHAQSLQSGLWAGVYSLYNQTGQPYLCSHPFILYWLHCMGFAIILPCTEGYNYWCQPNLLFSEYQYNASVSWLVPSCLKGNLFSV